MEGRKTQSSGRHYRGIIEFAHLENRSSDEWVCTTAAPSLFYCKFFSRLLFSFFSPSFLSVLFFFSLFLFLFLLLPPSTPPPLSLSFFLRQDFSL